MAVRRILMWCAFAAGVLVASHLGALAQTNTLEYAVKANFLYKFGEYVSWPPEALGPPGSPAVVCIVGDDPFGDALEKAVAGERIGPHPVVIKRLSTATADIVCQILFTRGSARQSTADTLKAVSGHPVLTITEASNYGAGGGVINFILRDGRVRFEIDLQAAGANQLEISSKLLGLAVAVKAAGGPQ